MSERSSLIVRSIGFVVFENKNEITITTSLSPDQVADPLTIPKGAIVRRRRVRL